MREVVQNLLSNITRLCDYEGLSFNQVLYFGPDGFNELKEIIAELDSMIEIRNGKPIAPAMLPGLVDTEHPILRYAGYSFRIEII